jgi:hypothetical protein
MPRRRTAAAESGPSRFSQSANNRSENIEIPATEVHHFEQPVEKDRSENLVEVLSPKIGANGHRLATSTTNLRTPLASASFSHQIAHRLTKFESSEKEFSFAKRYGPLLGTRDDKHATQRYAREALSLLKHDADHQTRIRENYFRYQNEQLLKHSKISEGNTLNLSSKTEDGLFAEVSFSNNTNSRTATELLQATDQKQLGVCCSADVHLTDKEKSVAVPHDHDHASGFIAVDLDEAAHGVYASTKYMVDLMSGNPAAISHELQNAATLLATSPRDSLIKDIVPDGAVEFGVGVGAGVGVLPLAALAIHAGIHEMQDANAQLLVLKKKDASIQSGLALTTLLKDIRSDAKAQTTFFHQAKADLDFAKTLAHNDMGIGATSFLSGSVIALKAGTDIAVKTTLVGLEKKFTLLDIAQQGTQIGLAGLVTGAAGTLVLGPLAGIFATGLGVYFVRKATSKRAQLKRDFVLAKQHISSSLHTLNLTGESKARHEIYAKFIERQGVKRIDFFKRFGRWNKSFLAGAGLYAATATTKLVVVSLALAGIGALASNPVGLGVLLGVGIVGSLIMGVSSLAFFSGHGKQGRYSKQTSNEHAGVDRDFLASLDLVKEVGEGRPIDQKGAIDWLTRGLDARSACLQWLDVRKQGIHEFVKLAAESSKKLPPNSPKNHLWGKWWSGARTAASYASTLATTANAGEARQAARITRMNVRRDLGSRQVENWLGDNSGETAFFQFASKDLSAKADYLTLKLKNRFDMVDQSSPNLPEVAHKESADILNAYIRHLANQDAAMEKDQAELELCRALLDQIDTASRVTNDEHRSRLMKNLGDYFGAPATLPKDVSAERLISKVMVRELKKDVKEARGVLFETQLQASRVREASSTDILFSKKDEVVKRFSGLMRFGRKKKGD